MKRKAETVEDLAIQHVQTLELADDKVYVVPSPVERLIEEALAPDTDYALMDPEAAAGYYEAEYFEIPGFDLLPEDLHAPIFKAALQVGAVRATIQLQKAIADQTALNVINGQINRQTCLAIEKCDPALLFEAFAKNLSLLNKRIAETA